MFERYYSVFRYCLALTWCSKNVFWVNRNRGHKQSLGGGTAPLAPLQRWYCICPRQETRWCDRSSPIWFFRPSLLRQTISCCRFWNSLLITETTGWPSTTPILHGDIPIMPNFYSVPTSTAPPLAWRGSTACAALSCLQGWSRWVSESEDSVRSTALFRLVIESRNSVSVRTLKSKFAQVRILSVRWDWREKLYKWYIDEDFFGPKINRKKVI